MRDVGTPINFEINWKFNLDIIVKSSHPVRTRAGPYRAQCSQDAACPLNRRSPRSLPSCLPKQRHLAQLLATIRCGLPGKTPPVSHPKIGAGGPASATPAVSNLRLSAPIAQEVNSQCMMLGPNISSGILWTTFERHIRTPSDWAARAKDVRSHAKAATSPRRQADQRLAATIAWIQRPLYAMGHCTASKHQLRSMPLASRRGWKTRGGQQETHSGRIVWPCLQRKLCLRMPDDTPCPYGAFQNHQLPASIPTICGRHSGAKLE